ncbi:DNA primase [Candidatus Woesearchaeota archaeon]|nr:DNA primase [Candidatus Woesearchaeota archaeon]
MGKVSPVVSKYIVHTSISIDGVVDRPDVIGAIFGQTEGLLGEELELRELQRTGRIGRIEVNVETRGGKTKGAIIIPSSLDKAETAIIGAALEIIQRIGPCNAKLRVEKIEDVRVSKRNFVISRAKELLKELLDTSMPDSAELAEEVAASVRTMEIREFGKERLPAGPAIDESDEILIVEGRADVINLLKYGIKNAIAVNGTSVPQTIIELTKQKTVTVFVDGDRGGDLIIKELLAVGDIDYITKAPDGKEVEEITKKEIHMALRSRVPAEQVKQEGGFRHQPANSNYEQRPPQATRSMPPQQQEQRPPMGEQREPRFDRERTEQRPEPRQERPMEARPQERPRAPLSPEERQKFKEMLEDLVGTRGAYILDEQLNLLGKVPTSELLTTLKSLSTGAHAIVLDGAVDPKLVQTAEKTSVKYLVGMELKVNKKDTKLTLVALSEL